MDASSNMFAPNGLFLMLALDHRSSFKEMLGEASDEEIIARKKEIIEALRGKTSGILVDVEYGLEALRRAGADAPFLLAMEKSGYEERGEVRHTELAHTAREIRAAGAAGAKLLLYVRGDEKDEPQAAVARAACKDAESAALPLFLELVVYGEGRDAVGERTLAAMKLLQGRGVRPAVWKLEAPGSPELCRTVTEAAGETPWILLSRGTEFERFVRELKESVSAGAKGFLVGRSLWQEALSLGEEERRRFLQEKVAERFDTLQAVLDEVH